MKFQTLALALLSLAWPSESTFGQSAGQTFALDVKPADSRAAGQLTAILSSAGKEVLRQEMTLPWSGRWPFDPAASGTSLRFESATLWAGSLTLDGTDRQVEVLPRAELVFQVEKGDKPDPQPPTITVEVTSAPPALPTTLPATRPKEGFKLKKTRLACALAGERWRCPAPALGLDLRLDLPGYVPHYVWNTLLEPGKTLDLGKLRFQKGASISGWVTVAEGEPKGAKVGVNVANSLAGNPHEGERHELRQLQTIANDRGFFQVQGIAPGGYRLEAERAGLISTGAGPVEVREAAETVLSDALHLDRAAELELHISPPLSPLQKPWKVRLMREQPGQNFAVEEAKKEVGADGVWLGDGLRPGSYFLDIASPDGERTGAGDDSVWFSQTLALLPGRQPLWVEVPTIEIAGTFRAGDLPIQGRLIFGGFHGVPHVALWSDEEGLFAGALPRAGAWDLDVEIDGQVRTVAPVTIAERKSGKVRVDVQLADTRFAGRVTHKGEPVAGAELYAYLQTPAGGRFEAKTDEEGRFEVLGTAPGSYRVETQSARLRLGSVPLHAEIREGDKETEVEIALEEFFKVEGQILAGGLPVAAADFRIHLQAPRGPDSRGGRTDATGVFRALLPESTTRIDLAVAPHGFSWRLARLPVNLGRTGAPPFLIEVDQSGGELRLAVADVPAAMAGGTIVVDSAEMPLGSLFRLLERADAVGGTTRTIVFHRASAGFYQVCISGRCAEGPLGVGGRLDLDLTGDEKGGVPPQEKQQSIK